MYTMAVVMTNGLRLTAVARTKKAVVLWRDQHFKPEELAAWRLHDGHGWADGSPDSWQHIMQIVGHQAEIVI